MPPRLAANLSWLFTDAPFLQRFKRAAACDFKAVEFLFPYELAPPEAIAAECRDLALEVALFNAPPGDWEGGDRGTGALPGREAEFEAGVREALRYAEAVRCENVHVMAGLLEQGACERTFADRLRWASDEAARQGATICVEPLNGRDVPGYLVPDTSTALRLLGEVGRPNCKLQLDLYHLQVSEGDLSTRVRALLPHTAHVQLANPPGRHEPGAGEVDFPPLLRLLGELGYEGHVGCEYKPSSGDSEASLEGWAAEFM